MKHIKKFAKVVFAVLVAITAITIIEKMELYWTYIGEYNYVEYEKAYYNVGNGTLYADMERSDDDGIKVYQDLDGRHGYKIVFSDGEEVIARQIYKCMKEVDTDRWG